MTLCSKDNKIAYFAVPNDELERCNRILNMDYIDFEEEGICRNKTVYAVATHFTNGYVARIEVYAGEYNASVIGTLYDQNELEVAILDPIYDSLDNVFVFEHHGDEYVVSISKQMFFKARLS